MQLKAVIFDRDNTLLRLDRAHVAQFEQRVHTIAEQIPPGSAVQHWMNWDGGWPRTAADEDRFWQDFWSTLGNRHALPSAQIRQLQALGAFYHTVFAAYPDTIPCLTRLRNGDIRMAILTNFDLPSIDRTLQHAGIDPTWFDALCSSAELGVRKPAAAAYLAVLERLDLAPTECLFVDDLIENVLGAQQIGMPAILIDRQNRHIDYAGERLHNLDMLLM